MKHDFYPKNMVQVKIHRHLPPSSNTVILGSSGHWIHKALLVQPIDSNSQSMAEVFRSSWLLQRTQGHTENELHRDSGLAPLLHISGVHFCANRNH